MSKSSKNFGKKKYASPPVLNAPAGLPKTVAVPPAKRKMSMTVGLVSLGAAALAGGVWLEARQTRIRAEECRAEAARRGLPPDNCPSARSSGGSHSSGRSWYSSSGSSSSHSTSDHGGSSTSHGLFGGFGHAGHAHSGGS